MQLVLAFNQILFFLLISFLADHSYFWLIFLFNISICPSWSLFIFSLRLFLMNGFLYFFPSCHIISSGRANNWTQLYSHFLWGQILFYWCTSHEMHSTWNRPMIISQFYSEMHEDLYSFAIFGLFIYFYQFGWRAGWIWSSFGQFPMFVKYG